MMEWIITSSALILIVAALRLTLKGKISLRLRYALWALVLVRLLCPVNLISSPTSILNVTKEAAAQPEIRNVVETIRKPLVLESQGVIEEEETGETVPVTKFTILLDSENPDHWYSAEEILMQVWFLGILMTLGFMLTCNLHFRWKLGRNRRAVEVTDTSLPVYVSDAAETPCMFGLFHPTIYLTPETVENSEKLRHVLEHELTHYYHGDYVTAPLRCLALALHWYNPLVWWAAKASRLDGELACDEGTIARLGEGERSSYGVTLIQMTCEHPKLSDVMLTATTMSGSKGSIKERIRCIAQKPHMAALTVAVVVLTALIAVGCTFTGASPGLSKSVKAEILEHGEEYINEIGFSWVREEENEPYVLLFLPEYMPKEGLTFELKAVKEDGTEEILYTQDTIELGERYVFTVDDMERYGNLKLKAFYMVDEKTVGLMNRDYSLEKWEESQKSTQMANSVRNLMSDYASAYFTKIMDRHNSQLFLEDGERYTGVVYQAPNQIVTPMAEQQNLYLYKYNGRFIREDGERISEVVYVLMHWGSDYWQRVCRVDQETIDSYNTPELVEKYGTYFDAAAIELYLKYKDDAVELEDTALILIEYSQNNEVVEALKPQAENFILYTIQQDYPDQSLSVNVVELELMELSPEDPDYKLCRLSYYPRLPDGSQGKNYDWYLVVTKDEMGIDYFLRSYDANLFLTDEAMTSRDETARAMIWEEMKQE